METSLYAPVKRFLESLGAPGQIVVKGEVGGCDLVALHEGETPVVVVCELKMSFNLELVLQAVDRAGCADEVWLAASLSKRGKGRESDARFRNLCRRLGFGMLGVDGEGRSGNPRQSHRPATPARSAPTLAPRRRAPPAQGRPRSRRRLKKPDHDRVPPAGAFLRGRAGLQRP